MATAKHPLRMLSANSNDARIQALERRLTGRPSDKQDERVPENAVTPLKKHSAQGPPSAAMQNDPAAVAARAAVKKRKTDLVPGDSGLGTGRQRAGASDIFGMQEEGGSRGPTAASHAPLQPPSPFVGNAHSRSSPWSSPPVCTALPLPCMPATFRPHFPPA